MKIPSISFPHLHAKPQPLNSYQTELRDIAKGTFPTVLTDDQAKLLKNPVVKAKGGDAGMVTMIYNLKDPASAAALGKALNDGWDGLNENINEGLDTIGMTDLKITSKGKQVIVEMNYKVGS